jgi:hypothetical protein
MYCLLEEIKRVNASKVILLNITINVINLDYFLYRAIFVLHFT